MTSLRHRSTEEASGAVVAALVFLSIAAVAFAAIRIMEVAAVPLSGAVTPVRFDEVSYLEIRSLAASTSERLADLAGRSGDSSPEPSLLGRQIGEEWEGLSIPLSAFFADRGATGQLADIDRIDSTLGVVSARLNDGASPAQALAPLDQVVERIGSLVEDVSAFEAEERSLAALSLETASGEAVAGLADRAITLVGLALLAAFGMIGLARGIQLAQDGAGTTSATNHSVDRLRNANPSVATAAAGP